MKLSIFFISLNLIFSIFCAEELDAKNRLKSEIIKKQILFLKNASIHSLQRDIIGIQKIKETLLKEDPEINDLSEYENYTNNLYATVECIKFDEFYTAKKILNRLYKENPDLDFDNIQNYIDLIIDSIYNQLPSNKP